MRIPAELLSTINQRAFWPRTLKVWNYRVRVPSVDRLFYAILHRWRFLGVEERQFFVTHLKPGMTVVDVGMNIGLYTLMFAELVGTCGRVYGFEPDPLLFEVAQSNVQLNRAQDVIVAHNVALGSRSTGATLSRGIFNSGDNRLSADRGRGIGVPVRVVCLDEVLSEKAIDWIKMDVQGWELEVLRGMNRILGRCAPKIYFEFWPEGLRKAGENPTNLFAMLLSMGYEICYPTSLKRTLKGEELQTLVKALGASRYTNLVARKADMSSS